MKTIEQVEERIIDREKALSKTRGYIKNSKEDDNYDIEDLEGELDNIKADLRILRWVLD
jgi:hypothetical protein